MKNTFNLQRELAESDDLFTGLLALPHEDRLRLLGEPRGVGSHHAVVATVRILVRSVSSNAVDQG